MPDPGMWMIKSDQLAQDQLVQEPGGLCEDGRSWSDWWGRLFNAPDLQTCCRRLGTRASRASTRRRLTRYFRCLRATVSLSASSPVSTNPMLP
jgi:hypothetical protein